MSKRIIFPVMYQPGGFVDIRSFHGITTKKLILPSVGESYPYMDSGAKIVYKDGEEVEIWTPNGDEWRF